MKEIGFVVLVVQALVLGTSAQCLRSCGNVVTAAAPVVSSCGCGSSVVPASVVSMQVPSVANSLAETLSLLTVSSLLAETLPLGPAFVTSVPVGSIGSWDCPWGGYGCGGDCGGFWGGDYGGGCGGGCGCGCGGGCGGGYGGGCGGGWGGGCGCGYGLGYNILY